MKILTIVGARPQFIKAAAVSRQIGLRTGLEECLVHTGQHFDANMSSTFFEELGIPEPKHNLGVAGLAHGAMTGRMLEALEVVLMAERPDVTLVYGDTNSTLAGALASAKLHIPVAHVEAGLRSFNRRMPEEINRVLTDHCADLLFAPTEAAVANLKNEGLPQDRVVLTGDVMLDVALRVSRTLSQRPEILERHALQDGRYVLATVHRQETTDDLDRLAAVVGGLARVAETMPVVLPLHPRTKGRIEKAGLTEVASRITLLPPVGFRDMVALTSKAAVVATDSGGLQKEAFFHRVPCATLRTETEWVELLETGWNRLADLSDAQSIARSILDMCGVRGGEMNAYGDGRASETIVETLVATFRG